MGLNSLVRSRGYRNFMAKLYGLGASIVIIGALFKINHYPGADYMLIVGLGTESIIFFFSAFEPPHVEPDWSLVYPQLAGIYHGDETGVDIPRSATGELDKMLKEANIDQGLIDSLGKGLVNLKETTSKLSDVSNAAVATNEFSQKVKEASASASVLTDAYTKTSQTLNESTNISSQHLHHVENASKNAAQLANAYKQTTDALVAESNANQQFLNTITTASNSAAKLSEQYADSAQKIAKSAEMFDVTTAGGNEFNKQLKKVVDNLTALNSLYEMQMKGSNEQAEATGKLKETTNMFMKNLTESIEQTTKYKNEVDVLVKNIASLNKVYGNMLSAMNVPSTK
ncbi:MAG: gliding motility protein GldL [Bacteroidetes bacterium]|nr:gliding motility protein GldL [Bacteroidota bacterium]